MNFDGINPDGINPDGEAEWLIVDNEQTIFLLRHCNDEVKREKLLDKLSTNNGELKRLFEILKGKKNELHETIGKTVGPSHHKSRPRPD